MNDQKKKIAVVLSGCGVFDGTEIHEAVLTLLAIEEEGASWHCFAPNVEQMHVINHSTGNVEEGETRNVFVESARISRGGEKISELDEYDPTDFDAIVFPGGFGGAKNLSDFAVCGGEAEVQSSVTNAVRSTHAMSKPIGFICITPASVGALTLGGDGVELTIGNDPDTASAVVQCGAKHTDCPVENVVVDFENKVVSTPAYMLGPGVSDVRKGISNLVNEVLKLT
ncbi:MAG: isoprenoid biosynthesis glyoxalase ElbB [Opitutae bacterium]|nr:isoprenoid biosynthesis glyoxalase ElbB [Opitutae bacterium]